MAGQRPRLSEVRFTVTDQSGFVKEPHLKGSFTNWDQIPMAEIGDGLWEHVQMVAPGTYEWGAVEPDGTEWGVWLPELAGNRVNLVVTVTMSLTVEGATSIFIGDGHIPRPTSGSFLEGLSPKDRAGLDEILRLLSRASMMNVLQVIISARAPLRFSRIQDLCAISATSLSRRLKELEKAGLVRRYSHNTIPLTVEYQATQVAFELEPTLRELYSWAIDNRESLRGP